MKIYLNQNSKLRRFNRRGGFAGISAATIGTIAGVASAGVGIASAAGAFKPDAPKPPAGQTIQQAYTEATKQIEADQVQIKAEADKAAAAQKSQKIWLWVSIGAGVLAVGAIIFGLTRKSK